MKHIGLVFIFCLVATLLGQSPVLYSGTWTSTSNGGGGKLTLSLTDSALALATFTYQGQDVKTKPVSLKKNNDQVDFVFEYTLDGNALRSRMQGAATPNGLKGKYQSTTTDGSPVDEGTWEVTQQQ